MSWPDFMRYFDGIDVCEVERGISDLTLNAHEIGAWKAIVNKECPEMQILKSETTLTFIFID